MNLQNTYFSFLGGDARTPWARAYLEEAGCPVVELSHPKLTHIVLPLPALTASGSIPGGCSLTELETTLRPGITLLGGKLEEMCIRDRGRISVPMWPFNLSGRLLIVALVGHYPTN